MSSWRRPFFDEEGNQRCQGNAENTTGQPLNSVRYRRGLALVLGASRSISARQGLEEHGSGTLGVQLQVFILKADYVVGCEFVNQPLTTVVAVRDTSLDGGLQYCDVESAAGSAALSSREFSFDVDDALAVSHAKTPPPSVEAGIARLAIKDRRNLSRGFASSELREGSVLEFLVHKDQRRTRTRRNCEGLWPSGCDHLTCLTRGPCTYRSQSTRD